MEVHNHKVNTSLENLKEVPFTNNSKLVPLASMTLIHPVVRKLFTEEIPNVPLETYLSLVKGYQILKKNKIKSFSTNPFISGELSKATAFMVTPEIIVNALTFCF